MTTLKIFPNDLIDSLLSIYKKAEEEEEEEEEDLMSKNGCKTALNFFQI